MPQLSKKLDFLGFYARTWEWGLPGFSTTIASENQFQVMVGKVIFNKIQKAAFGWVSWSHIPPHENSKISTPLVMYESRVYEWLLLRWFTDCHSCRVDSYTPSLLPKVATIGISMVPDSLEDGNLRKVAAEVWTSKINTLTFKGPIWSLSEVFF